MDDPCCEDEDPGDDSKNGCISFRLGFPILPRETRIGAQGFQINRNDPSPSLFTPQSLSCTSLALTYVQRITAPDQLPAGISHEVFITDRKNVPVRYQVQSGQTLGHPVAEFTSLNLRLQLLGAQKDPVTENPAFYRLLQGNGAYIDYPVALGAPPSAFRDRNGRHLDLAAMLGDDFQLVLATGTFRQVRSAAGLADIVVTDDFGYEIRLYTPDNTGDFVNGLYQPVGQAYRTVRIENPTGDLNRADQVRIIDTHGTHTRIDLFNYVPAAEDWELTEGEGEHQRTEQLIVEHDPDTGLEIKTRELRGHQNQLISRVVQHIQEFPWNRAVIKKIEDPGGLDLITTLEYYDNPNEPGRYSRERLVTRADGSWVRYDYDAEGRRIQKVTPWLDSPPESEPGDAVETIYDYTPVDPADVPELFDIRPRTVIIKTLGVETARTYHAYITDPQTGARTTLTERAAAPGFAYGNPANHRELQTFFSPEDEPVRAGRLQFSRRSDGVYTAHDYEETPEGDWVETTTRDLIEDNASLVPLDAKSTRVIRVRDARNNVVSETSEVFQDDAWHPLSETQSLYGREISNGRNPLLMQFRDGRELLTQTWEGPHVVERIDEQGLLTLFEYDSLQRLATETRIPLNGPPIVTQYERTLGAISCGCDGAQTVTISAGDLELTHSKTTDAAGRHAKQTNANGAVTEWAYLDNGRTTVQTNPDGSTVITETYLDGRTQSVTGTGTVHQGFEYGVNPDGSQWTRLTSGDTWQQSTTNMLGQTVEQRQPGYDNTELVTTMTYNTKGQLTQTQTFSSDNSTLHPLTSTLYEYNALGEQIRTVQDINRNETVDFAGPDRITESSRTFVQAPSDSSAPSAPSDPWWQESRSYIYNEGSDQPLLVSTSRQRITDLGTPHPDDASLGLLVSESVSIDIHGNESIARRYINRDLQTVYTEQISPFSDTKATSLTVGGLLQEQRDTAGITTTFDYDALQRQVGTTDARTGRSFVTYAPGSSLITKQTDAAGNETLFAYDTTGRQIAVTDPEGNTTHTAYTLRGETAVTWGATYPVVYEYDSQGRMIHLHTLRDPDHVFNSDVSPTGILTSTLSTLTSPMDTTTWVYEESTGLLLEKLYADNNGPSYTYIPDGRLHTRTWARTTAHGEPPTAHPLITTYHYDPDTLELTQITYSDDTPSVTNTYDRLGRLVSTTDAFGEKTYTFNPATLQPHTEIWNGLVETTLTRAYDTQGRPTGFSLGSAHTVTHTYTDTGRFHAVSYVNDVNQVQHTATYTYTPNSPLISGYTLGDLTRTVTYENNRNLVNTVTNIYDVITISAFDYTNDDAGRRTDRSDSGTAFSSTQANTFAYNTRNEITSATMRNGNSSYSFDQIGNRLEVSVPDEPNPLDYTANGLNQYTLIDGGTASSPSYDADGNLTHDGEDQWFSWNGENRLIEARDYDQTPVDGSTRTLFTYDAQGRRVRKVNESYNLTSDLWTLTSDLRYLYDGWNLLYEIDTLSTAPTRYYVWGLDLSQSMQEAGGVGGLLLTLSDGTAHAVSYDANGNISEYIDLADGSVDAHLEYDAFGRTIASTYGVPPASFGFSTKYQDAETGYYYYGFRYYDPETGRWPNRDPIKELGGLNIYGFVGNDAVNWFDDLGHRRRRGDQFRKHNNRRRERGASDATDDASRHTTNDRRQPNRVEYCGRVCQNVITQKVYHTGPVRGISTPTRSACNPNSAPKCGPCSRQLGVYHSHTARSGYGPPSPGDKDFAERTGKPVYTGRGVGNVEKVNPDRSVEVITSGGRLLP